MAPKEKSAAAAAADIQEDSLETIRRKTTRGEVYALPGSGHKLRLIRPVFRALAAAGALTNPYAAVVVKWLNEPGRSMEKQGEEERNAAYISQSKVFFAAAALCIAGPGGFDPEGKDPSKLWPEDLADRDYMWLLFDFAEGEDVDVARFRVSGSAGTPGQDSPALPYET